jgi:hypothetical protein
MVALRSLLCLALVNMAVLKKNALGESRALLEIGVR